MKIIFKKTYIIIITKKIVYFSGFFSGVNKKAKGAALFPFIFVKSEEFLQPWLINHERIHFRQQIELLFVGSFLISFIEKIYARFFKNKTKLNSYLYISAEQEAYLNQNNFEYLKTRNLWAQFYYVKNKKNFTLGKQGEILF